MILASVAFAAALWAPSASAQTARVEPAPPDIVVHAPPDAGIVPDTTITAAPVPPGGSVVALKTRYEKAQMFARCAMKINGAQARAVIDAPPNSPNANAALERLEIGSLACIPDRPDLSRGVLPDSAQRAGADAKAEAATADRGPGVNSALYHRGAVVEEVLRRYVPDLALTAQMTSDDLIRTRFQTREGPRNALRLPEDQRYFRIVACMVREQPELAVRLVQAGAGSRSERWIARALANRARACAGSPQRLIVQPIEFRIYVADAVYRWAVAARGVDTLVPAE